MVMRKKKIINDYPECTKVSTNKSKEVWKKSGFLVEPRKRMATEQKAVILLTLLCD